MSWRHPDGGGGVLWDSSPFADVWEATTPSGAWDSGSAMILVSIRGKGKRKRVYRSWWYIKTQRAEVRRSENAVDLDYQRKVNFGHYFPLDT